MDRLSVHQKSTKQAKAKKKPIKVVYISNPMKVTTSAAEFRSLVQQLTGQDSVIADIDLSKFPRAPDSAGNSLVAPTSGSRDACDPSTVRRSYGPDEGLATPLEVHEEVFTPQMLGNFSEFMSATLCCEPHLGGSFRSLEKV